MRLHRAEKWPIGTIAMQLRVHHTTVRRLLAQAGVPVPVRASRASLIEPYRAFLVETLAKYSGVDLKLSATGDIAHHLVEDVAITLGRAYRKALGDGPIKRIASATAS